MRAETQNPRKLERAPIESRTPKVNHEPKVPRSPLINLKKKIETFGPLDKKITPPKLGTLPPPSNYNQNVKTRTYFNPKENVRYPNSYVATGTGFSALSIRTKKMELCAIISTGQRERDEVTGRDQNKKREKM